MIYIKRIITNIDINLIKAYRKPYKRLLKGYIEGPLTALIRLFNDV